MNLLLDTHVALWAITDSPKLSAKARELILNVDNTVSVSTGTVWEIAIKHALHPVHMPVSSHDAVGYFRAAGYHLLAISAEHAAAVEDLPALHRDPFDRILVAQALVEPLHLMTHDRKVAAYSDEIVVV